MGMHGISESPAANAAWAGLRAAIGPSPRRAATARRLLSHASRPQPDPLATASGVTVTWGTAGASPTIASAVRIAPKRSGAVIDVENDPHFLFVGAIPGRLDVSSGDMTYPNYLTGGTSQSRRNLTRIKFLHTGTAVEVYLRARVTSLGYRFWVDGLPVTTTMQTQAASVGNRFYAKLAFGSSATRLIEVELDDQEFGGVAIGPTDSITRPRRNLLLAALGDSHTAGANGVASFDTWVRRTAQIIGCDFVNLGVGGSGYLNDNGTSGANYRNRITPDLIAVSPDIVIVEGSWNDGTAPAGLGDEAAYVFSTIAAALPDALLIATGPHINNHNSYTAMATNEAALRAAAQASRWNGFVSFRDPLRIAAGATAWATATAYAVGDVVSYNGYAQVCTVAHTSGSWDQTKWRSTALINGTGKVGATAGNGNADVLISSDGTHLSLLGHSVKGRFIADEALRVARTVAAGSTWAD